MASKRMFDKSIIDTDRFTDMPMSTKALYFLLGMEADDHGFVPPKRIMRMHGGSDDDIKLLVAKGFVIPFENGVVVITDWYKHNWLDKRRIKPTEYKKELTELAIIDNQYCLASTVPALSEFLANAPQPLSNGLASAEQMLRESSIEESSTEEYRADISAELPADAGPPRSTADDQIVVKTKPEQGTENVAITLTLNDKTEHPILQTEVDMWIDLYPAVDVSRELRGMKGWLHANPTKRKTKRGINTFINSWLSKAQDKGGCGYGGVNNGARGTSDGRVRTNAQISDPTDKYKNIKSVKL